MNLQPFYIRSHRQHPAVYHIHDTQARLDTWYRFRSNESSCIHESYRPELYRVLSRLPTARLQNHYNLSRFPLILSFHHMKTSLTKKQLAYILSATSSPRSSRPTLSYAYYLADTHVVVSTDSFQLHEIQNIDLWPDNLIIDSKGIQSSPIYGCKFPDYLSFFHANPSYQFKTTLNVDNIKLIRKISEHATEYRVILTNWTLTPLQTSRHNKLDTLDFSSRIYHAKSGHNNPPPIAFNVDFLYQHARHIDKPHLTTISISSPLHPIVFESLIDGTPVRTIIMPLKF